MSANWHFVLRKKSALRALCLVFFIPPFSAHTASIRNVVLCIGDGMGPAQVEAAGCFAGTNLCFEAFPYQSTMATVSADSTITDSAAAATAMATGTKVDNYVLSLKIPGDGSNLETLVEYFKARDKATGLVATSYITHATPAAFGAHSDCRNNLCEVAGDYLNETRPNVLFGGGGYGMNTNSAIEAGYTVVTDATELFALDTEAETFVSGQFGTTHMPYECDGLDNLPHLHEMTQVALDILDNDPDGFFLMVEGSRIDHACHDNNIINTIHETLEFESSIETVMDWMGEREDTLLVVTADHECGGLTVIANNGAGNYPEVAWSTGNHTAAHVPVYGIGLNAHFVTNVVDNTDIHTLASCIALVPEQCLGMCCDPSEIRMSWTASSGDVYRVEYRSDLVSSNWVPLITTTATTSRLCITDTNQTDTARFYRLISLETMEPE